MADGVMQRCEAAPPPAQDPRLTEHLSAALQALLAPTALATKGGRITATVNLILACVTGRRCTCTSLVCSCGSHMKRLQSGDLRVVAPSARTSTQDALQLVKFVPRDTNTREFAFSAMRLVRQYSAEDLSQLSNQSLWNQVIPQVVGFWDTNAKGTRWYTTTQASTSASQQASKMPRAAHFFHGYYLNPDHALDLALMEHCVAKASQVLASASSPSRSQPPACPCAACLIAVGCHVRSIHSSSRRSLPRTSSLHSRRASAQSSSRVSHCRPQLDEPRNGPALPLLWRSLNHHASRPAQNPVVREKQISVNHSFLI
eukprot:COSAG01_NODE_9762_length_2351_cov_10.014210_2_plen_315_part_00